MTKKPTFSVTPRADVDVDALIRRRLEGNPFGGGTTEIPLREPDKWQTRISNGALHPSRNYEMRMKLAWIPVTVDDLPEGVTPESIGFTVSETGALCRGARGEEVVWKMDKEHFAQVMARKTEVNKKGMGNASVVKNDMLNAVGSAHGDEAANFINRNVHVYGSDTVQKG